MVFICILTLSYTKKISLTHQPAAYNIAVSVVYFHPIVFYEKVIAAGFRYIIYHSPAICGVNGLRRQVLPMLSAIATLFILPPPTSGWWGPSGAGAAGRWQAAISGKNEFYFGSTGGGVWKTIDGGSNWKNISDKYFGGSIGAIAVAQADETIIYAGEGESTLRSNVSEGLGGMWRSDDGGHTWRNAGLKDSRHIVRIVIDPKHPDIVWAAVMGHLFGPSEERGVYKTTDGGKTWKRVLYVNAQTGCSELVMEPGNPSVLYAVCGMPYARPGAWKAAERAAAYIRAPMAAKPG